MNRSLFLVLLGRHEYGLTPEEETAWCRICLLLGIIAGFVLGAWAS